MEHQKKLGAVAINNLVISVNEVPDRTSNSVIEDMNCIICVA